MGTSIVPANIQVPAHLANKLGAPSALSAAISSGLTSGSSVPRISIKGARFRINDGGVETVLQDHTLSVIIVGANPALSKIWYEAAWTPDAEPGQPDCFSMDGVRPSMDSKKPQHDLCATCPQNQWGSKVTPNGQKIKACADHKRLAVVAANDPTGPVYLLQVTPAALKGLNQYHKELSMRSIPAEIVETKISFDTTASFPKLTFSFGKFITAETQQAIEPLFGSSDVREITGELDTPPPAVSIAAPAKPVLVKEEVVVPTPPTPPKRGFAAAPVQVAEKPTPVVSEPPAAKVAQSTVADDISKLLADMGMDDDDAS